MRVSFTFPLDYYVLAAMSFVFLLSSLDFILYITEYKRIRDERTCFNATVAIVPAIYLNDLNIKTSAMIDIDMHSIEVIWHYTIQRVTSMEQFDKVMSCFP